MRYRRPRLTFWLIGFNVTAFILLLIGDGEAFVFFGQMGLLVLRYHFFWQVFTAIFVHFNFVHLLSNIYGLTYFGLLNESLYTGKRFLTIYFTSGILGNIVSLFLLPAETLSGGASGAIFGLIGAYVAYERKLRHLGGALSYAILIFLQSMGFGVNVFAHLFGFIGGFTSGLYFTQGLHADR